MLIRVQYKNLLSFNNEVEFNMLPNLKRQSLPSHIINREQLPLLKMAAVYGANGSGKSNLVKGLNFLRQFVIQKDYVMMLKAEGDFDRLFFRLKKEVQPFKILIEFSVNGLFFIYHIKISHNGVDKEELLESGVGKKENVLVFKREGDTFTAHTTPSSELSTAIQTLLRKNRFSSLLSLNDSFPVLSDKRAEMAFSWFKNRLVVYDINTRIPSLLEMLRKNKKILDFTNLIFQKLGLGIDNVSVNEEDYESWASKHQMLSLPLASKDRRNGVISLFHNQTQAYTVIKNKVYSFLFKQRGEDGYVGDLDAISQSDGTIKLLTLLPAIYDCINKDKTVVIDEINNCLHPSIVEGIVGLFANNDNSKGQLVFTTHDIELLDVKDIMRSDEIWFTDKKDGGTIMYSHNIFKEHNTLSILRGYKEGRFGAIKYID